MHAIKLRNKDLLLPSMKKKPALLFLLLFALLAFIQLFQQAFHPIRLAGLHGVYDAGTWPELTADNWFGGKFQPQAEYWLKYHTAFNAELVQLRNQIDYSVFGNINTILTLGKDNYIFDPNYIYAREGTDLLSDSVMERKKELLENGKKLLDSLGIPVLFCFAPNKADFYSDQLPAASVASANTNQRRFHDLLSSYGITVIDFNAWFMELKPKSAYALVTKYGAHWSTYGACLAADSLLKAASFLTGKKMASFSVTAIDMLPKAKFSDDDYLASLNLMFKWKSPVMAYPVLSFSDGYKPDVLFISDSFMWNFYDLEVIQHSFGEQSSVRYYNKTGYDKHKNKVGPLPEKLTLDDIKNRELILVMSTGPSLKDFGYGFFEQLAGIRK